MLHIVLGYEEGGHCQHPKQAPGDQGSPEGETPAVPVPAELCGLLGLPGWPEETFFRIMWIMNMGRCLLDAQPPRLLRRTETAAVRTQNEIGKY